MRRPALGALLLLASCSPGAGRRGETVILASGADLESINPLLTTHPLARQVQRYALLTTLVRYDTALATIPYFATGWTWARDSLGLTFRIFSGLKWNDGQPTTAYDAAWTLERAMDPATGYPRQADLADMTDVWAPDDTTLEIRYSRRQRQIPDVLTDLAILPRHLLENVEPGDLRRAAWNQRPVGNGPFRFVSHQPGRRWVFARNPDFPAGARRPTPARAVRRRGGGRTHHQARGAHVGRARLRRDQSGARRVRTEESRAGGARLSPALHLRGGPQYAAPALRQAPGPPRDDAPGQSRGDRQWGPLRIRDSGRRSPAATDGARRREAATLRAGPRDPAAWRSASPLRAAHGRQRRSRPRADAPGPVRGRRHHGA